MTGFKRKTKGVISAALMLVLVFTGFGGLNAAAIGDYVNGSDSLYRTSISDVENYLTSTTYKTYLDIYGNTAWGKEMSIDVSKYNTDSSNGTIKLVNDLDGASQVLICGDDSSVAFDVTVKEDSLYNILVEYYTGDFDYGDHLIARSASVERYVLIDGVAPYKEARSVEFEKSWADSYTAFDENGRIVFNEDGSKSTYLSTDERFVEFLLNADNHKADAKRPFLKDTNGNELKPSKQLNGVWTEKLVFDSTGYYNTPLAFHFSAGTHTLGFQAVREPIAIKSITLLEAEATPTYQDYLARHGDAKDYTGESVVIQAEYSYLTSDNTIYQINDRSSSYTQPQDAALIRLNEIGGDKAQYVGQWIEWKVNIPETGFYSINPRWQQNYYSGMYVSRKIYIDGVCPFVEASNLRFNYSSDWHTDTLNDGTTEFKFYLEKGVRTIRLEAVLGDMAEVLNTVENSLARINEYYRKILMITGPDADTYRDYNFDKLIPDVLRGLAAQSKELYRVSELLSELTGEKGEQSTNLDRVALVCERMAQYPSKIASQMKTLKDYTAALGSWLSDAMNQPLDIDYISFQAVESDAPDAEPGFFGSMWYELQKFWMSFFSDYNSLGSLEENDTSGRNIKVEVWTAASRDQAQIIRSLVDDTFTPNYEDIGVEIKLVAGGTLLPATLAGTGPDIYLGAAQGDPVNYAIRSAVMSLNTKTGDTNVGYNFNDLKNSVWNEKNSDGSYKYPAYNRLIESGTIKEFDEVKTWFADQALIPVTLYGETYALPMTMSFSMMFYRKDIFVELGIEVPNTWDDFYDIIYTMQSNKLEIGFPQGTGGSMIMMYQQNEPLYDMGNYEYYNELFRRYFYEGDYNTITEEQKKQLDEQIFENGYTYKDADGNYIPKTDGMTINLDSDISLAAFKDCCQFFTAYDFPKAYDAANRFRSGEMPLIIQDYSAYNTLIVFAPEINGLWEFTPLPGIANELTQEVNNSTIGGISTVIMMRSVTEQNALGAWAFMQWWLSAETQSAYGNEMVALLGPSAKQPTANINALANMSWSADEYNNLFAQFNAVACTPEFPGSYIIGRYTNFAYLDVVNNKRDPIKEMQEQIVDINTELTRKRNEFKLPTSDWVREVERAVGEKYAGWDKDLKGGDDN